METPTTAGELRDLLESRQITSVELVEESLQRIERGDEDVGAFLSTADAEGLLATASAVDESRRRGEHASPFAGIPIAVKDNIAVTGEPLTCGSKILAPYKAPYDATAIERLRDAGLIIVGKTNMDEFGFGSSTENSAFQVTRNPRHRERVPGGTSGGSAAAVAAGFVPWALGTDTGGSVRQPASLCGVVGMRPSYGRVSRYGLVAYASSMDQIGPIANSVADAEALLALVAGPDERDSTCLPEMPESGAIDLDSLTVGIPDEYQSGDCDAAVLSTIDRTVEAIEGLGWRTTSVSLPLTRYALSAYYLISSVEASSNLGRYDGVRYGHRAQQAGTWLEMLTTTRSEGFGVEAKRRIMLGTFASSSGYYDEFYDNARRVRTKVVSEFQEAFARVDLLLSPVSPSTAWPLGERVDDPLAMYLSDVFSVPVALAGIPAMVIPAGDDEDGLPVGMQIAGSVLADGLVAGAAGLLEAELGYPMSQGFAS
jgi:aspartyl-tRNA(Asn)/glutamyl-tRNA(Gln) amidotransferase subunit A